MRLTKWCRIVIPRDRIFSSHQTATMYSFSCILFLRQMHLSLNVPYFSNFTLNYSYFRSRNVRFVKMFGERWCQNWHHTIKKDVLTSCMRVIRWHFLALVSHMEIPVGMQEYSIWGPRYFYTDRSKAVLLLWFLTVTCSWCLYLYFGSTIMLVTYFVNFR